MKAFIFRNMIKTIKTKQVDKNLIENLYNKTQLDRNIIELLCARNIDTPLKIDNFLNVHCNRMLSPYEIKDMDMAIKIINSAVESNKKILIYGDYDCDGITAISILKKYFSHIEYAVDYYLPDRNLEGYGLTNKSIENFVNKFNPDLVITVDCGISNAKEITLLQEKYNIDVLVTDHHELPSLLPNCVCINPKIDNTKLSNLAGVGVAYKLLEALTTREFALNFLDIVCIGTIADLVPLVGENRIIAKLGLELLNKRQIKGIKLLLEKANKVGKITEYDVGFVIAPRINGMGRMLNANEVVELFSSQEYFFLDCLTSKMEKTNNERRLLCDTIFESAKKKLENFDFENNKFIALYDKTWQIGVIGIVASRITEAFNLPTILFAEDNGILKGSGRSIPGVNLFEMLNEQSKNFISFGGHAQAAGLKFEINYFDLFVKLCNQYLNKNYKLSTFEPKINYDLDIDLQRLDTNFFEELQKFAPFGCGNQNPKVLYKNDGQNFKIFGKKHLKKKLKNGVEILAFNSANDIENFSNKSLMVLSISKNEYNDFITYQGIVKQNYNIGEVKNNDNYKFDYIKNMLYSPKDVNFEWIDSYFEIIENNNNLYGTIFVAFSPKAFNSFNNVVLKLPSMKKKTYISVVKNKNLIAPYNTIVLNPSKNFDFSKYNRVVFLETPLNMLYYNYIDNQKIYIIKDNIAFVDEFRKLKIDRELCKKFYMAINFFVTNHEHAKNIDDIWNILNTYDYKFEKLEFFILFYIFFELKLISIDKNFNIKINKKVKNPLENSIIYNTFSEFRGNK